MSDATLANDTATATETPVTTPATTEVASTPAKEAISDDAAALLEAAKRVFGEPDAEEVPAATETEAVAAEAEAKPVEAPKKPADEKTAERIARAHRAEERVKKQLEASHAARAKLAAEREQIQREREAIAQERAVYAKLKSGDPLEILDAVGIDKLDFVKRVAQAPEVVDPMAAKIAQLEARAEAAEQRRIQAEQAHAQREYQQGIAEAKHNFVQKLQANTEQFPNIVKAFSPAEAAHRGLQLAVEYGAAFHEKFGRKIDDAAVAEYLDYEAEQILASRTWGNGSPVSQTQQLSQSTRTATSEPAEVTHTLTNSGASTASVATRERTQEEIDAECVRLLAASYGR